MHIDLTKLTRDALISGGCEASLIEQLDPHSPIELEFAGHPSMRITLLDEGVVRLDTQINEYPLHDPGRFGSRLFDLISEPAPWALNQALCLVNLDGLFFLTAILGEAALQDGPALMAPIESFYERLVLVYEAMQV